MRLSVRARLTVLVAAVALAVLVALMAVGVGRMRRSLVADVLDDAAVEQLFVFDDFELLDPFGEGSTDGEPFVDEGAATDPFGELGDFDELDVMDVAAAIEDLDEIGALDELLTMVRSDRETGVPVMLSSGSVAVVDLGGGYRLLDVEPAGLGTPLVGYLTMIEVSIIASGPADLAVFEGLAEDEGAILDALAEVKPRIEFGVREFDGVDFVVGADIGDVDRSIDRLRSVLWYVSPFGVLGAGLVTWLLAGRALRPVAEITARTSEITSGTLDERVPEPGTGDEIDRLARTVNGMLDRLEVDDQRLRQFVSDASHELRSPVAVLRTEAEVALQRPDSTTVDELARGVLGEVGRLQRIVEDLLVLARREEGRPPAPAEPLDLDDVLLAEATRKRAVAMDVSAVSGGRVRIGSDAATGMIAHLLDNAARHAASRVVVGLRTEPDGATVTLWVDDDGPGVAPAERERVFERFTRLEAARTRDTGGAGLGLAVVKATTEDLGGSVTVVDSPLGGARFVVHLPSSH
ncbi:MAG: ATP-binding protein [Acidimicrobiales bacterium]